MATVNDFKFTHDEREINLGDLLPQIYKSIYDFKSLCNASGFELSKLYERVRSILNDQFIETCSLDTIARWEKYLKITPSGTDTIEERRFRVLTNLKDIPPYTERYLGAKLTELLGEGNWRINRHYNDYLIVVEVATDSIVNKETISKFVRSVTPANMEVMVIDFTSTHQRLSSFTHAELSAYTHNELENGEPILSQILGG